jgi:ATP-dependent Clp protease adaptor protein ClpS
MPDLQQQRWSMHNADDRDSGRVPTCSLCGESQDDVNDLAGGPAVFVRDFICDRCVGSELARLKSPTLAFSQGLEQSLRRAIALAGERPHERDIPEYLLLALTDDPDAAPVNTPMEFVVYVLEEVFELEHEDAVRVMLQTHHTGVGACGTFPRKEAEARAAQVTDLARRHQHPLRCFCVEQNGSSEAGGS